MESILALSVLLLLLFTVVQFAFLLSGRSAVETAGHFAARRFALSARKDLRKAKADALNEASTICRHRIGGRYSNLSMTTIDVLTIDGSGDERPPRSGDAYRIDLSHWFELVVPWANRILYLVAPARKVRLGERYYLILRSSRLVTVE